MHGNRHLQRPPLQLPKYIFELGRARAVNDPTPLISISISTPLFVVKGINYSLTEEHSTTNSAAQRYEKQRPEFL